MTSKPSRWHTCNVLRSGSDGWRLWQFEHAGDSVGMALERTLEQDALLPTRAVGKSWRNLWQRRLNVAWLPTTQVCLRVLHLPAGSPEEIPAMVEFQLEKLSPLPVGQVVWTVEPLPAPSGEAQTAIVIMVPREAVEEFLGRLEGSGYMADRLELPILRQLFSAAQPTDGVWICAQPELDQTLCLVAWWGKGRLQTLNLVSLTPGVGGAIALTELLKQVAWTGELEGWLSSKTRWHLVAESATAAALEPALREFVGGPIQLESPLGAPKLAALTAQATPQANLLPAEFAVRYRQRFVDRLWMRGLGALGLVYLFAVLAYFVALRVGEFRKGGVEADIAAVTPDYTNALQLKARVQVLQEQVNLRYAALDCWKAASEALPEEMSLTSMAFQRGKKLQLFGTVPGDQQGKVTEFNEALVKAQVRGQLLFAQVTTRSIQAPPPGQGGRPATWSIECDIQRAEVE